MRSARRRTGVSAGPPPPSIPSTLCALSAQAIHAAQGQPGREGRGYYPLGQLEEELDPAARTINHQPQQVHVHVIHVIRALQVPTVVDHPIYLVTRVFQVTPISQDFNVLFKESPRRRPLG
jgi:hypothetical protein